MLSRTIAITTGLRYYAAAAKPELSTIFPSKRVMNRLLFDYDSRLNFKNLYPIYESVYRSIDSDGFTLPNYATSADLMLMREVLGVIRKRTHATNRHLLALENELVEKAAELGNNDAVATLAFETINDPGNPEDMAHAKKLVIELFKLENPLTFKLSGDLAWAKKDVGQAEALYTRFLELEPNTATSSEVYKNLAFINFSKPDLLASQRYFEKSIKFGEAANVAQCHFYLGQLAHAQPSLARHHYEAGASQGLIEAFPALGFLEMNYYNNFAKAVEWFKLGVELRDSTALMGLFDCYVRMELWEKAEATLITIHVFFQKKRDSAEASAGEDSGAFEIYNVFLSSRGDTIETVKLAAAKAKQGGFIAPRFVPEEGKRKINVHETKSKSKWDI